MKKKEPVSAIMTKHIYSVQIKNTLMDAMELARKHNIRHIPVLKGKQLVGILSKNDLHRLSFNDIMPTDEADESVFEMLNISQVMSHKPRVVKSTDTIYHVAEILSKEEFHALPVVSESDETELVGIVTTTDVIRYMLEQY